MKEQGRYGHLVGDTRSIPVSADAEVGEVLHLDHLELNNMGAPSFDGTDHLSFQPLSNSQNGVYGMSTRMMNRPQGNHSTTNSFAADINGVSPSGSHFPWQLSYWRPYFKVTSDEVIARLRSNLTLWKWPEGKCLVDGFGPDIANTYPDLYGPVWAIVTIALCIGMISNSSSYLYRKWFMPVLTEESALLEWTANFEHLSTSLTFTAAAMGFLAAGLWAVLRFHIKIPTTLFETSSLVGYAFTVFIPAVIICIIPISKLQWLVLIVAAVRSGLYIWCNVRIHMEGPRTPFRKGSSPPVAALLILVLGVTTILLKNTFFPSQNYRQPLLKVIESNNQHYPPHLGTEHVGVHAELQPGHREAAAAPVDGGDMKKILLMDNQSQSDVSEIAHTATVHIDNGQVSPLLTDEPSEIIKKTTEPTASTVQL